MALPDRPADDLAEIEEDLPAVLTFGGTDYPCILGTLSSRAELSGLAGYREGVDQIALLRADLFDTAPVIRDSVTISGVVYQVMRTETDQLDGLTLYLQESDA